MKRIVVVGLGIVVALATPSAASGKSGNGTLNVETVYPAISESSKFDGC